MDGFVLPPVEALGGTLTLDELRVRARRGGGESAPANVFSG